MWRFPETDNVFRAFGDRRGSDRSGLGLGLSISRRAVAANGGEIRALSLPGKGCIFTIDLPARRRARVSHRLSRCGLALASACIRTAKLEGLEEPRRRCSGKRSRSGNRRRRSR